MKMRKGLCVLLFVLSLCGTTLGQNDPIRIGGRSVSPDGSVVYSTDVSILHLGFAGEIGMNLQYRVFQLQWVILITIPYYEINIPKNGTLSLYLKDGSHIVLPVEKEMAWSRDGIDVLVNNTNVHLMRIPYLVTEDQLLTLSEAGIVSRVTIVGTDRTITFEENVFSSIVARGIEEIRSMRGFGIPLSSDF
jgi:hypothetical protein